MIYVKEKFLSYLYTLNCFKVLGIDFGIRKTGLALYDSQINIVLPYLILQDILRNYQQIINILNKQDIKGIVIGYPLTLNCSKTKYTNIIVEFAEFLGTHCNIPITLSDERFTTSMANQLLKENNIKRKTRNKIDDLLAACIILENFFYKKR